MQTLILGATKGLGQAIASRIAMQGVATIEVGSSAQDGQTNNRILVQCDLRSQESVEELLQKLEALPAIDSFYWVAGRLLKGNLDEQTPAEVLETTDINFRNALLVAHWVWKKMRNAETRKTFCVISSSSGVKARTDEAVYVATKFAQVGFARSLGIENTNPNLFVSLVLPGGMKTHLWDHFPAGDYDAFLDPDKIANYICEHVHSQKDPFFELTIPRGSL